MTRIPRWASWPLPGLLAAVLVLIPTAPAADTAPAPRLVAAVVAADPQVPPEKAKQIAELEKQLAEIQKQLAEMKNGAAAPTQAPPKTFEGAVPDEFIKKMTWRAVGPASMGGRITGISVVESDPNTYFVATASGGLLKTTNNGTTFAHLFDKEATVSLGDVCVAPSDPKVVWVGTGEQNPRNSVSYGDGVYKSTDGGLTWKNMGLKGSYSIGKIVVHPKDPYVVYVAAMGRVYGPNPERGVFKTTDGGQTWAKVLFANDQTGAIDLRLDPFDPESVLVGLWERRRDEYDSFQDPAIRGSVLDAYGPIVTYGPGGGLFKSKDGGKSWTKLTGKDAKPGLPTVNTGRIGLDYSLKTKGLVYALIDTERAGFGRPVLSVYVGLTTEEEKGVGLKVTDAPADAPAGKAGVKAGDVIVSIDGTKIPDYDTFNAYLATKKPDETIKVAVKRKDGDAAVDVKLAPREEPKAEAKKEPAAGEAKKDEPEAKKGPRGKGPQRKGDAPAGKGGGAAAAQPAAAGPPTLGLRVEGPAENGAPIAAVQPEGPAEKAGLTVGEVIVSVAGKPVADQNALREVLTALKVGDKVKVSVRKDGKVREVELTVAAGPAGGGAGGRRAVNANRPHGTFPSGQSANVQDQQGKEGYQTGGLFVSKDGGDTWSRVNSINPRPFYFSQVRTDPTDDKVVYVLGDTTLYKSTDGGARFAAAPARGVHPDHHALWINPKDGRHLLLGCDGGTYVTYDRGTSWDHLNTHALGQFYHVAVDNRKPYRIYGGLQDNGNWAGPSQVLRATGPTNDDWGTFLGGDGFICRVDPTDPDLVYAESQDGNITRTNMRTGQRGSIRPAPVKPGEALRYNWQTPFILSHHNPSIVYSAAQYVFRSVNKGDGSKAVSPEITRTKVGTATALAESPRTPDVVWAGTDDGYVWVTKDGGAKWENVTDKITAAGLPGPRWVSSIEASRAKDGRCYVAFDAHRSDDDKPYLFATEDFGQTWQPITANLPAFGSTRVLREDYTNPDLLYCGTEFGIWASVNRGAAWARLNNNLPTVAVHDLAQPTTASEIVVATHGRSVWILDVASLRQMSAKTEKGADGEVTADPLKDPVTLFAPAAGVRWKLEVPRESSYSINLRKFYGTNPDRRVSLDYVLTKPAKELSLKVTDATGAVIRTFGNAGKEAGFHRQGWDLSRAGGGGGGRGGGGFGAVVPAGTYRVVLTVDGKEYAQAVTVENDPNADPKAVITAGSGFPLGEEEDEGEGEGPTAEDDE